MSDQDISPHTQEATRSSAHKRSWLQVTFAGLTTGNPLRATFHAVGTLRDGTKRHFSYVAQVTNIDLRDRLLNLEIGTEVRIQTETDWKAKGIPTFLIALDLVQKCNAECVSKTSA